MGNDWLVGVGAGDGLRNNWLVNGAAGGSLRNNWLVDGCLGRLRPRLTSQLFLSAAVGARTASQLFQPR